MSTIQDVFRSIYNGTFFLQRATMMQALPVRIVCASTHYGQVGVHDVVVVHRGRRFPYVLGETHGRHVQRSGDVTWLGPVAADAGSPLHRVDQDVAVYGIRPSA